MKVHTNKFKEKIAEHGKELDNKITYTYNDEVVELGNEDLNSITPHYESGILKSTMRQLDIESKEEIPVGTELNYQFGIRTRQGGDYEIYGETSQETTTQSDNMFDKTKATLNKYINNNGTLDNSTTASVSDFIACLPNTKYKVIRGEYSGSTNRVVYFKDASTVISAETFSNSASYIFTTPANTNYIRFQFPTTNIDIVELYTLASPSPDYPQPIETLTGEVTLDINGNEETINLGKNLFDKDNANILNIPVNGNPLNTSENAKSLYIPITGGKTYTIQKIKSSRFRVETTQIIPVVGASIDNYLANDNGTTITINTSLTANYLLVYYFLNGTDTLTEQQILDTIQIEEGTEATEYEPYFTPIELCKIGDYQDYIRKSTGKNLFDGETEIGYFDNNTGEKLSGGGNMRNKNIISVMPNTTYIISNNNAGASMNVLQYNNNNEFITANLVTANNSFTTLNETYYINFWRANNLSSISIQIEENSQITDYEPYGEVWYKHKEIGKIIYNGSENWVLSVSGTNYTSYYFTSSYPPTLNRELSICSHFEYGAANNVNKNCYQPYGTGAFGNNFCIENSKASTVNQFKSWLNSHNTIVYYVLATPTAEIITNETLIAQLEEIRQAYEYLDFGNYIVKEVEKQEDTNSWLIKCYDKMLYSMKDYESIGVTYPITIRSYISAVCNHLGLTFKNANDTFANYDKQINAELYLDAQGNTLGYTFRDLLDELAQVTGSTICINEDDDQLEIRYINDTGDTIDEEYLKDINVNFGEQYGPINTVVLSRAGGADKVYKSYPDDLPDDQKIAVEIADNQIMNFNDRADYLPDLLNRLNGLQYYLNDYVSPGIAYYNLCDRYNVQIGEETYSCVMFNDEINITQGLVENIHTDMPEIAQTDYTKADKTDRKVNQTYLIVDKQNQTIESVVSNVSVQDAKISQITQTVDEINSKISDIADITISGESNFATFTLDDINQSEPIQIKVKPISDNISYLYPFDGLYPSDTLYLKERKIRFHNNTTNEDIDYELPDDLLIYDSTHYDEFLLDYGSGTPETQICQVTKRCKYNADGTIGLLSEEQIIDYPYPTILLADGDYTLSLMGYEYGYLFMRLMAKNIYTTQFYTKAETDSHINQKANEIELGVNQTLSNYSTTTQMNSAINVKANEINQTVSTKVGKNEVISNINQTAETIKINASKVNLNGYVTVSNLSTAGQTTINGSNITTGTINCNLLNGGTISGQTITGGTINGTTINTDKNLTVGNNAYIGQNQSTSLQDDKYLYFSEKSYIRRTKVPSGEMFFFLGGGTTSIGPSEWNSASIRVGSNTMQILMPDDNMTSTSPMMTVGYNDIWMAVQPSIGSDERLKKDIKNTDVSWINELKVKEFEYKKIPKKKQIGLIAQDYENKDYKKYFLNTFTDENGQTYYSIAYGSIQNALIQYCQEMNKKIEQQQETINNLTQRIEKLEKESEK